MYEEFLFFFEIQFNRKKKDFDSRRIRYVNKFVIRLFNTKTTKNYKYSKFASQYYPLSKDIIYEYNMK